MMENYRSFKHSHNALWCRDSQGRGYTYDEYMELARSFHGFAAPGLIIGGRMVNIGLQRLPEGSLFDAISETAHCLPDAIQLLTPCTTGNGWLKVIGLGRFALILYDKFEGQGIRVFLDPPRLDAWPDIKNWFYKIKSKSEQDIELLRKRIEEAGSSIFSSREVQIRPQLLKRRDSGKTINCPLCGEAFPVRHGSICRGCRGEAPYFPPVDMGPEERSGTPRMISIPAEVAGGRKVLHDMTQIIPGRIKGPAFKRGQTIRAGDICRLHQMGRMRLYVDDPSLSTEDWVHEDSAAASFARVMAGDGVSYGEPPKEGKITFKASHDGLLVVDRCRLEAFNLASSVMCATRQSYSVVSRGRELGATRAIPLYLSRKSMQTALTALGDGPLLQVLPLRSARVGILVTGTEIFQGLVKDGFDPIIRAKVKKLGCRVTSSMIVPDSREAIRDAVLALLEAGIDLLVTTAGLSVDPDDVTRQGLVDAGAMDVIYGAPILPGAMTLLARIGPVKVIGVPACALYFKTTGGDRLLPRGRAGGERTRRDLALMGHGSFCLGCKVCRFPKCPFGR
ncbi:MAG: FmdE family protein [Desulfatiglans sp.]|nr:FmdE family protein [Desulfatiglans sp.]